LALVGNVKLFNVSSFIKRDVLGWGLLLWFAGYLLGFVFYAILPTALIGWFVMPIGSGLACVVLWKWCRVDSIGASLLLGAAWSAIAIVKLLNPPDGYYKPDVYLYYLITLVLPLAAARLRRGVFAHNARVHHSRNPIAAPAAKGRGLFEQRSDRGWWLRPDPA
jgi:hypothetical protein